MIFMMLLGCVAVAVITHHKIIRNNTVSLKITSTVPFSNYF